MGSIRSHAGKSLENLIDEFVKFLDWFQRFSELFVEWLGHLLRLVLVAAAAPLVLVLCALQEEKIG